MSVVMKLHQRADDLTFLYTSPPAPVSPGKTCSGTGCSRPAGGVRSLRGEHDAIRLHLHRGCHLWPSAAPGDRPPMMQVRARNKQSPWQGIARPAAVPAMVYDMMDVHPVIVRMHVLPCYTSMSTKAGPHICAFTGLYSLICNGMPIGVLLPVHIEVFGCY